MNIRWISLIVMLALVLTGCGSFQVGAQDEFLVPSPPLGAPEGDTTEMTSTPIDPGLQSLVEIAKEDLAQRLSIPVAQITLMEAKAVVWPDSSLGCPQPGMDYLQVPEDGALIILRVKETDYEYHNGGSRGLFLCEMVYKETNPPPQIDIFNITPSKSDSLTPDNSIPPGEDQ